jgi:enoyl-CoA hydratase/carnithine racemase
MSTTDIEVHTEQGIGWIAFNRPEVSNAVRPETMRQLCAAIDRYVADESVKALVITGNGKHFSAGGDFEFLQNLTVSPAEATRGSLYEWFAGAARRLWYCPKPTVAAVNGAAITVGCEISLACDVRIADERASFRESWLHLGLLAPLGGAVLLPRLIGFGRAKEMILSARTVNAPEAVAIGLASEVVPVAELHATAQRRALELTEFPAASYRLAKESLQRPLSADMEREWQANVMAQSLLICSDEFRNRVAKNTPRR